MLSNTILDMYKKVLNINNNKLTDLILSPPDQAHPAEWSNAMNIYSKVVLPIGIFLIVIFFILAIYKAILNDGLTPNKHLAQALVKPTLGVMISLTLITGFGASNKNVLITIYEFTQSMMNELVQVAGETEDGESNLEAQAEFINQQTKEGFAVVENGEIVVGTKFQMLGGLDNFFAIFLPWIMASIGQIYATIMVYGRNLELIILFIMAPMAIADSGYKGSEGAGFRYLKEWAAISLQGFLMLLVLMIFGSTQASGLAGDSGLINHLAMFLASLMLLGKTRSIARQVVGLG